MTKFAASTWLAVCATLLIFSGCLEERSTDEEDAGGAGGAVSPGANDSAADDDASESADTGTADEPDAEPVEIVRLELGRDCVASAECESGWCALPCDGWGTCAPSSCATDDDCAIPGGSTTHCCNDGVCSAIRGDTCGGRNGDQGASCAIGGASDCAPDHACVDACLPSAFCAAACSGNESCEAIDADLSCYEVFGGGTQCVPDPDKLGQCEVPSDCGRGAGCAPALSFSGADVIKMCTPTDATLAVGARCIDNAECRSSACLSGLCSAGCRADADCACNGDPSCRRDQICIDVWFGLGGGLSGSTALCFPEDRCESTADCTFSECVAYAQPDGWISICQFPPPNALAANMPCASDAECASSACHEGICRSVCARDEHCTDGGTCQSTALGGPGGPDASINLCR